MTRRNPGSTWLVVLRADALEEWLKANHPGIQRKGPKGYKSLCNSDTSLVAYLRWCTHGVEIGAVHRAFVVSAATGTEAALKGLKEFNAATAKMYQPLHSMAIERVLPGPVYVAEIYDRETSAVEYEPFTPASKDEMLRGVQERASQYDEGFDLKVAAFSRAPATLGRRFIEGTAENIDFARNRVDMSEVAADDARDQTDEVSGMAAGPGFSVGLPQTMWSPAMMKAYAKGDENAFDQAYLELKSRARTEEHADQVRKSMLPELSKADMQRKLTGNPYKVVIPLVSGIAYLQNARRNPSSSSELYHATLSGKNDEIVLSMIEGIDSSRAQGFGQGQGFYLFTNRKEAVDHARGLVSGRGFVKEVKVEGEPIIVVVDAPLTPENYDADYEVSAADFRRFLFEHKDWIRDNASKLGLVFGPAYTSTSRFTPDVISVPDRITLTTTGKRTVTFTITAEPPADETPNTGLAQHLSTLAQRIAAVAPELLLQFEESTLKTMPAVKYVGPKIQPARIERPDGTVIWRRGVRSNPLVGFERVPWKPSYAPRSEATFLSTAYPRLWKEALKNTELKIRVLVARDAAHMGDIGKNLMAIDAEAKRAGEIVILLLPMASNSGYALEGMIGATKPAVGDSQRLSRPSPFMILHNLAEALMMEEQVAKRIFKSDARDWDIPRSSIDPARVDTWAGRRGALEDSGNALADLFAKYVTTGKVAYTGTTAETSAIKKFLDTMVDYLKRNPGVYEALTGKYRAPASERNLKSLSTPAPETRKIPIDIEEFLENPTDLAGRHVPDRYLAGLPTALQKQRIGELTQSRDDYKLGDYSELPTDRIARKMGLVKQSQYTTEAKIRGIEYRGDLRDMAKRVMVFYGHRATSGEVQQFADALRKSFAKGLAAWKSGGHRPGATAQNWAVARVNSLVVGGKTSWTADKKLFEVLPAAVRAKIESMRAKQNPIEVEVRGTSKATKSGPHTRFFQSESALARIVEQGKEVVPRIKFIVDWGAGRSNKRGTPGVVTLISRADRLQEGVDSLQKMFPERSSRVSLYTAHTMLHRLGDAIMPKPLDIRWMPYRSAAVRGVPREDLVVTGRAEAAYRKLGPVLIRAEDHLGGEKKLDKWLPTVVDTKACREGWVVEGDQALAELVPYRLLYEKGRKNGVKLLSTLPFVPELESTLTEYIDAMMDMLVGHEVMI